MLNLGVRSMEWTKSNTCPFDTFSNLKKHINSQPRQQLWRHVGCNAQDPHPMQIQVDHKLQATQCAIDFANAPQIHQWQFGTKIVINRNRQTKIFKWTPTLLNFSICLFIIVMILRFISNTHFQHDPDHKNAKNARFPMIFCPNIVHIAGFVQSHSDGTKFFLTLSGKVRVGLDPTYARTKNPI